MSTNNTLYTQISELGSILNLCFSCHETAGNKIIALDGIKRTLLIADRQNAGSQYVVIELVHIKHVLVKKVYACGKPGENSASYQDRLLNGIYLEFIFSNKPASFALAFYTAAANKITDLVRLEKKTYNWQRLLLQLSGSHPARVNSL